MTINIFAYKIWKIGSLVLEISPKAAYEKGKAEYVSKDETQNTGTLYKIIYIKNIYPFHIKII